MLNLLSSSGTTMSTSTNTADEDGADSGGMMPIFKSYNPDFISPEKQRHGRQQSMQEHHIRYIETIVSLIIMLSLNIVYNVVH